MRFDISVAKLITKAYETETDVYLRMPVSFTKEIISDGIKTLILFPSPFFLKDCTPFYSGAENIDYSRINYSSDILFADVRFMCDASFRRFITENNYRRIMPVFAECTLIGEYGYKESYSWIGEYRAEITHFCQIVPVFSSCIENIEDYRNIFASMNAVVIGECRKSEVNAYKTNSPVSKFYHTAAEAEKYAFRKITVYFNSRSELRDFGRFLDKRGTSYMYIDGSMSCEESLRRLKEYNLGKTNILLATKSFIPVSLFYPSDIVFLCGVPFTLSHIERLACSSSGAFLKIIYCEEDYLRNNRIIHSLAEVLADKNVYMKGAKHLSEIKNILEAY